MLEQVRLVSFDLDDTLWDCAPAIHRAETALYHWFEQHAPRVTANCTPADIGQRRQAYVAEHPEYLADVSLLRKNIISLLLREHSYPSQWVDEAYQVFYHARSQVDLYKGAVDVLERLKPRFKLAALTNGNADLAIVGIDHLFDDIRRASIALPPKPHSAMFHQSSAALGFPPEQMIHIGDNPDTDVQGARNAGAVTVWFNQQTMIWPDHLQPADFEIKELEELLPLLGL